MHQSMNALRVVDTVVPENVVLRYVHWTMAFVAAVHTRELYRVSGNSKTATRQPTKRATELELIAHAMNQP